jgi:predicted DNA-binding ribbon-helix-helix protein
VKRSITISGRVTSISLEDDFLEALREIATERGTTVPRLVTSIKRGRRKGNLSSKIRLYVLGYYQGQQRSPSA